MFDPPNLSCWNDVNISHGNASMDEGDHYLFTCSIQAYYNRMVSQGSMTYAISYH